MRATFGRQPTRERWLENREGEIFSAKARNQLETKFRRSGSSVEVVQQQSRARGIEMLVLLAVCRWVAIMNRGRRSRELRRGDEAVQVATIELLALAFVKQG